MTFKPMKGKRKAVVEAAKYLGNFTVYMLWLTLRATGHEFERYEISRYIYRLRQMGLVTQESNSWSDGRQKIWRVIDKNFTTVGKSIGVTSAAVRAVAASNSQFYLRGFKKTVKKFTREDLATVLVRMRKQNKIMARPSLAKNVNIYFK